MNPAYLIRTVEVIVGPRTAERTVTALMCLLSTLARKSIVVNDSPGFVTGRLLHPVINDAACLVDEGVAAAADVDALMLGYLVLAAHRGHDQDRQPRRRARSAPRANRHPRTSLVSCCGTRLPKVTSASRPAADSMSTKGIPSER